MSKVEKTYREIQQFDNCATAFFVKNEYWDKTTQQFTSKEPTKFVAALKNVTKQCGKHFETFMELQEETLIDNCAVDEKTKIILKEADGKSYKFTKEGAKARNKAIKELSEQTVTLHDRIVKAEDLGELELTAEEKEAFSGLVIPEIPKPPTDPEDE